MDGKKYVRYDTYDDFTTYSPILWSSYLLWSLFIWISYPRDQYVRGPEKKLITFPGYHQLVYHFAGYQIVVDQCSPTQVC